MAHKIIWLPDEAFDELKDYIITGSYVFKENSIALDKFIFMPERLNATMSDKPKVTLTRQAAADMLRRHTLDVGSNIDNMINFYVEAGMLEVVEEPTRSYVPIGFEFPFSKYDSWAECCKALVDQGYVIIKDQKPKNIG